MLGGGNGDTGWGDILHIVYRHPQLAGRRVGSSDVLEPGTQVVDLR